jgi:hypothetical protein
MLGAAVESFINISHINNEAATKQADSNAAVVQN